MEMLMEIRCPNCGSFAQRLLSDRLPVCHRCPDQQVTQIECSVCDYLLIMCQQDGQVLEAYAPGTTKTMQFQKMPESCTIAPSEHLKVSEAEILLFPVCSLFPVEKDRVPTSD